MTEVSTLLRSMAGNSWKKLTGASKGSFDNVVLPRTRANFDALNTWADDAAVGNTPMAGIAPASYTNIITFSAPAISDSGLVVVWGGGHTNGGDSSGFYFDVEAAAASINASGAGGTWGLAWKGARLLDAFTQSKPAWSFEPDGTTPTGQNQAYWADDNADGQHMFPAQHSYWMTQFMPGTNQILVSGCNKFDGNGLNQKGSGACWVIDLATPGAPTITGPFQPPSYPTHAGSGTGYHVNINRGNFDGVAPVINDLDGSVWSLGSSMFNSLLFKWSNPTDPVNVTLTWPGWFGNIEPNPFSDLLLFPDPADPVTKRAIFQNRRAGNTGQFLLIQDIAGTPSEVAGVYASSVAPRQANVSYTWDSSRNKIIVSDCADLYRVNVSADTGAWSIEKITSGATGDIPDIPTLNSFPRVKYLASEDAYVVADYGDVWLYKPSDWVDPEGGGSPIPAIMQHYRRRRAA